LIIGYETALGWIPRPQVRIKSIIIHTNDEKVAVCTLSDSSSSSSDDSFSDLEDIGLVRRRVRYLETFQDSGESEEEEGHDELDTSDDELFRPVRHRVVPIHSESEDEAEEEGGVHGEEVGMSDGESGETGAASTSVLPKCPTD
jgi:hypothetical protein